MMTPLLAIDATTIALDFLLADLEIREENQDFFSILSLRPASSDWYIVD